MRARYDKGQHSILYSNRAFANLKLKQYEKVVKDTHRALLLNADNLKVARSHCENRPNHIVITTVPIAKLPFSMHVRPNKVTRHALQNAEHDMSTFEGYIRPLNFERPFERACHLQPVRTSRALIGAVPQGPRALRARPLRGGEDRRPGDAPLRGGQRGPGSRSGNERAMEGGRDTK